MLGSLLSKNFKKLKESYSMSKAVRMSSTYLKLNLGLLRLYSLIYLDSSKPMNIFARTELMENPWLLHRFDCKTYCQKWNESIMEQKGKFFLSSFLEMLRLELWLEIRFIVISMVCWSRTLVKSLVTSSKRKNLSERFAFLIWERNEKVSFARVIIRN